MFAQQTPLITSVPNRMFFGKSDKEKEKPVEETKSEEKAQNETKEDKDEKKIEESASSSESENEVSAEDLKKIKALFAE